MRMLVKTKPNPNSDWIAQLGEHLFYKQDVAGSNPALVITKVVERIQSIEDNDNSSLYDVLDILDKCGCEIVIREKQ